MKRSLATYLALLALASVATAQTSYTATGYTGAAGGYAASTGYGVLNDGAPFGTGSQVADFAHPGTSVRNIDGGLNGVGYSDAGYALVTDPNAGTFYRFDPADGSLTHVVTPGGGGVHAAQMNPVTGAITYLGVDGVYYRQDADGTTHTLPAPPVALAQWGRPDASNQFVGTDLSNSYEFDGTAWELIPRGQFSALLLTEVDPSGTVGYVSGTGTLNGARVVVGGKRDGAGFDLFSTGLSATAYSAFSGPTPYGQLLAVSNLDSDLVTIGGGDSFFANPVGMTPLVERPIAGRTGFVATFYDGNFAPSPYTVQGVPEPTTVAALGIGALALVRRRKKA